LFAASNVAAAANSLAVTINPSCPEWELGAPGQPMIQPTITIRYDANSPDAHLKPSQGLSVILATAIMFTRFESTTIPMEASEDGVWQATYTPKKNYILGYSIFFFRDAAGHVDNNRAQYWEILNCDHSEVDSYAVETQASTYEGGLLAPGIQRQPDLSRGIEILEADIKARPKAITHYPILWGLQLMQGHYTPAAYDRCAKELDAFLDAHGNDVLAMRNVMSFVAVNQRKLPSTAVERFRAALIALPQIADPFQINAVTKEIIHIPRTARFIAGVQQDVERGLAEFDFDSIEESQGDPRTKAAAYLAFIDKYPNTSRAFSAYDEAFRCEKTLNDLPAAEAIFDRWIALDPPEVLPLLDMAQFYIESKTNPGRAIELLDRAEKIYSESELPSSHRHFSRKPGFLESLRGRAHLLLNDLPAARADFEAAHKTAPDDPAIAYSLGQTCERLADTNAALNAYLAAASAPYQENPAPREAYERLFVMQKLGDKHDADERIAVQVGARIRSAAAAYTPLPVNRPAPEFAFTDLAGKRFNNDTLKGKPAVLTFWGIWCSPCVAELPALTEFETHHPEANMLAVEIGNKPAEINAFLATHKLAGLHVASSADWPEGFGAPQSPTSIVLDRFGQIQFVHAGLLPDVEAVLGKDLSALPLK